MVSAGVVTVAMVGAATEAIRVSLAPVDVPERIEVKDGAVLVLTWADGSTTTIEAAEVRAACQCATCLAGEPPPQPEGIAILEASVVGAYGLNLTFGPDQHRTGIYPFDRLRLLGERT